VFDNILSQAAEEMSIFRSQCNSDITSLGGLLTMTWEERDELPRLAKIGADKWIRRKVLMNGVVA
jgi:hypothetical protein